MAALEDPALPEWLQDGLDTVVTTVQDYGWFMVIGGAALYWLYHKATKKIHRHQVYNPDRVERLDMDRRMQRLKQQQLWDQQASELHALTREREKSKDRKKDQRKYNKKKKEDALNADWLDGPGSGGGRIVSSLSERYKGRGGG